MKKTYRYDKATDEMVEVQRGGGSRGPSVRVRPGRFVVQSQAPWGGGTAECPSPDWPGYVTDRSSPDYGQPYISTTSQIPDVCARTGLSYGEEHGTER